MQIMPSLGFAGIGLMGLPMCRRLLAAGYPLRVWNRSADKCLPLLQEGAGRVETPAELCADAEVVMLCLADTAAVREVWEEAGIEARNLTLRGVVTIDTGFDEFGRRPGVVMFVFVGETEERTLWPSAEGAPAWLPVEDLARYALVDDLGELLPRALAGPFFYGHYSPQPDGTLRYEFQSPISNLYSQVLLRLEI